MKPSATRALERASTYTEARAELSLMACDLAPWRVKCSVLGAVSSCPGSGGSWASGASSISPPISSASLGTPTSLFVRLPGQTRPGEATRLGSGDERDRDRCVRDDRHRGRRRPGGATRGGTGVAARRSPGRSRRSEGDRRSLRPRRRDGCGGLLRRKCPPHAPLGRGLRPQPADEAVGTGGVRAAGRRASPRWRLDHPDERPDPRSDVGKRRRRLGQRRPGGLREGGRRRDAAWTSTERGQPRMGA